MTTPEEVIEYAAILGESEETALLFFFHYEAVGWSYTNANGIEVPYRKWKPLFDKWRVRGRTLRAQSERMFAEQLDFWKQKQNRRDAERAHERKQRAQEHNPAMQGRVYATIVLNGYTYYEHAWYLEQINVYGASVNSKLLKVFDNNNKPFWRYK